MEEKEPKINNEENEQNNSENGLKDGQIADSNQQNGIQDSYRQKMFLKKRSFEQSGMNHEEMVLEEEGIQLNGNKGETGIQNSGNEKGIEKKIKLDEEMELEQINLQEQSQEKQDNNKESQNQNSEKLNEDAENIHQISEHGQKQEQEIQQDQIQINDGIQVEDAENCLQEDKNKIQEDTSSQKKSVKRGDIFEDMIMNEEQEEQKEERKEDPAQEQQQKSEQQKQEKEKEKEKKKYIKIEYCKDYKQRKLKIPEKYKHRIIKPLSVIYEETQNKLKEHFIKFPPRNNQIFSNTNNNPIQNTGLIGGGNNASGNDFINNLANQMVNMLQQQFGGQLNLNNNNNNNPVQNQQNQSQDALSAQNIKNMKIIDKSLSQFLDKYKEKKSKRKESEYLAKKREKQVPGIEIFVDIDGTLFNDPSLHVALLLIIKDKSKEQYENLIKNEEFLDSIFETENLLRPKIEKLLQFFSEIKKTFPFIYFSIFTANPQIKSYEKIIKQLEKRLGMGQIFDNYLLAAKGGGRKLVKDIQLYSMCTHSYIIDNNNTCKQEQILNLIPVITFSAIEYLSEKNKQFYLKYLTQFQLESVLISKNEKQIMKETTGIQQSQSFDWGNEIENIIQQIQMIINNLIVSDEKLMELMQ